MLRDVPVLLDGGPWLLYARDPETSLARQTFQFSPLLGVGEVRDFG